MGAQEASGKPGNKFSVRYSLRFEVYEKLSFMHL